MSLIQPYKINVPQSDLDNLKERLQRARWPDELTGVGWSRGVPLSYLKELAERWSSGYDWREHEARLNEFPNSLLLSMARTSTSFMCPRQNPTPSP